MRAEVLIICGEDCPHLAAISEHGQRQMCGHEIALVKVSIQGDEIHRSSGRPICECCRHVRDCRTRLALIGGNLGTDCCDRLHIGIGLSRSTSRRHDEQLELLATR